MRPSVPPGNQPSHEPLVSRRMSLLVGAVVVGTVLAGCSTDPNSVAGQARSGDRKGYISGDGLSEHIAAADRGEPVELAGATLDGQQWSSQSEKGRVVVINKWASWCAPCVIEAPEIEQVWKDVLAADKPVQFMGINFRESPATGLAFATSRGLTYPSLTDEDGTHILALQGRATATPSTVILDREGRIAAHVSGAVTASTLAGLIDDVLADQ